MGTGKSKTALLVVCALALASCSKTENLAKLVQYIQEPSNQKQVTVNFCTDPAAPEKTVVKTLVILDHSGSNKENYLMATDGSGAPQIVNNSITISTSYATDPTGILRYGTPTTPGTLLNYLATTPANDPKNPTRYFALIDFSTQATTYPANSAGFTSDVQAFYNYVLRDSVGNSNTGTGSPTDGGSTSYLSALSSAYTIINSDIQNAKSCAALSPSSAPTSNCPSPGVAVTSAYVIVFMSDGSPITNISGIGVDASGNVVVTGTISITKEPTSDILGEVQTIMGLSSNTKYVAGINLFTIYYYNPANNIDQSGQSLLAQMAKSGNGLAYNAVSGSKINYSQFVPPSKTIKYTLSDIFVTNRNVTWWNDGSLRLDSDADGLPDDVEAQWGSNPNDSNSFGNGVSDFVQYQLANGKPISSPTNYAAGACSGVSSSQVGGKTVFKSSDPDGLNDCEKVLLSDSGGVANPDSNGDIVPDWLEFKNGVPFQLGAASAADSSSDDGYTLYQKIKFSLPTNYPLSQILNLQPASYNLTEVSTSATQDCYNLQVTHLPMIGDTNSIRVDVIEKSELLQDRYLYRVGTKAFSSGVTNLQFNDWNNAAEITAGTWKEWP